MINDFAGKDYFGSRVVQERIDNIVGSYEVNESEEAGDYEDVEAVERRLDALDIMMTSHGELTQDELQEQQDLEELKELLEFKENVDSREWNYGLTFIKDDEFEDYAREEAVSLGFILKDTQWPVLV